MKLKPNLTLRKIGSTYVLVDIPDNDLTTQQVHTLNETAAFVWKAASENGVDPDRLAGMLCEEYDVDRATAEADVSAMLGSWKALGLLV